MAQDIQSIESLLSGGGRELDEESIGGQFQKKQREIKMKEMEKKTKQHADSLGLPYMDLFGFPIGPEALSIIPEQQAIRLGTVCFYYDGENLKIATYDIQNPELPGLLESLNEKYYTKGVVYLVSKNSLDYALRMYRNLPKIRKAPKGVEITAEDLDKFSEKFTSFKDLQAEVDKANITDIITMIMAAALKSNSSDIHIEAEEENIKIRYRIDGVLHDSANISKDLWKKIISRLKVLAKVKINISDRPQDGRMSLILGNQKVDVRVSFLPTNYGESVVMRLLKQSTAGLTFEDLGLRGKAFEQLKREIEKPNGMVITTGPTGSGKTTTLYAILKRINTPETKIITIEDPVEYQLEGISQSQISEKYTFAQGLRSIVRQDPDVIMVGEIRDLETAEIAIQSALTGHLVFSTIHTNDAAGTVPRFLSMGVKPFLLAPALNAMLGQRLVRLICKHCKTEDNLDEETLQRVKGILETLPEEEKAKIDFNNLKFYKGVGCEACQGIGYKGRIGIYEVVTMGPDVERLILSGNVSEYDMRDIAAKTGTIFMVQDGILKALSGDTSVGEVFRVVE